MMAGWLSREALAGHQIVLNLAALSFMVPLGISQGAAARVGNLIGAGDLPGMRRAVRAALLLGAGAMSFSALSFIGLRYELPRLYSEELSVVLLAAQVFPLAAAFQLSDGTQVVAAGVLRGMGRPDGAALVNLLGYYVAALPLAYVLTFTQGRGLPGIWVRSRSASRWWRWPSWRGWRESHGGRSTPWKCAANYDSSNGSNVRRAAQSGCLSPIALRAHRHV